jgi:hydrogenase maturation protein HypF
VPPTATTLRSTRRKPDSSWIGRSIRLPFHVESPIVALGPQLKNTVCLARNRIATMSDVHGDLSVPENFRACTKTIKTVLQQLESTAQGKTDQPGNLLVHDLHPNYATTLFARSLNAERLAVQHHHAHGVACAVDAGVDLPIIAIVCDGTGYGTDGAIWGGEILLCRTDSFERLAHLDYFGLPGGDAAALAPWRCADAVVLDALAEGEPSPAINYRGVSKVERSLVRQQIKNAVNTTPTSSLGRLFDAAAAMLGITTRNSHEGEAAMKLQAAAESWAQQNQSDIEPYPFYMLANDAQTVRLDWRPMIRSMHEEVATPTPGPDRRAHNRTSVAQSAYRFHLTVAAMFADAAARAAQNLRLPYVALSGGCFLNALLLRLISNRLNAHKITAVTHHQVSCGDAGLSLGQAAIGAAVAARRNRTLRETRTCASPFQER